jgi:hypothetical protein
MMKSSTMVLVGGAGLIGAMLLFSQKETDVLDDDVTPSYVAPDEIDTPDNKDTINQGDYDYGGDLLPSTNMWRNKDGKTIRIYHPLKNDSQLGSYFDSFYFDVKLTVDWMSSIYNPDDDKTIDDLPETLGDYTWELTRSGSGTESSRWTTLQNGNDIRGLITKSVLYNTIEQITPTWNDVLMAFDGYMPGKKVAGPNLTLSGGQLSDTGGNYQYVAYYENGTEVPTSLFASNTVKLQYAMSGEAISMNIKLKYRCGNSGNYTLYSSATYPFPSPYFGEYGTGGYYFPIETAPEVIRNPQGVLFGCTIPTKTNSYPVMLHVDAGEGNTSSLGSSHTQVWELVGTPADWTGAVSNSWEDDGHRAWSILFDSYGIPMVFHDASGLYVKSRQTDKHKIYLKNHIVGIDAIYQRKSCTGVCPGGTAKVGQTITRYDTSLCDASRLVNAPECGGMATDGGGSSSGGNGGGSSSGDGVIDYIGGVGNILLNAENVNYILSSQSYINL